MRIDVKPGNYVVAVSGGVDSVVLLDLLTQLPGLQLTVAHFDHGIRDDSDQDATLVKELAQQYGLDFAVEQGKLGAGASEATAREVRYGFLNRVQQQTNAQAIITAHHQDDLLETAILNILRGTGRRGLTSLKSNETLRRPLLHVPKSDIQAYAIKHKLSWREDSTNHDERYTRNYIRHRLLVRFDADARQQLLTLLAQLGQINTEADALIAEQLQAHIVNNGIQRSWFNGLRHDVSKEVLAAWLRSNNIADFDRRTLERITVGVKTKPPGKRLQVLHGYQVAIEPQYLALELVER